MEVLNLKKNDDLFEDIFKQNEKCIYYHMYKLSIRDPFDAFYSEGWIAYQKYEPNKGPSPLTSFTPSQSPHRFNPKENQ